MTIRLAVVFLTLFGAAAGTAALFAIGDSLAKPHSSAVTGPPDDLSLEVLSIPRDDGVKVAAWFAKGEDDQGGILLVHGIRSDRRAMLPRARFLLEAGYSVLLIDLQAHGETTGEWITFGYRESRDVAAGDYEHAVTADQRDEIGFLVESFNEMTQALKTSSLASSGVSAPAC